MDHKDVGIIILAGILITPAVLPDHVQLEGGVAYKPADQPYEPVDMPHTHSESNYRVVFRGDIPQASNVTSRTVSISHSADMYVEKAK